MQQVGGMLAATGEVAAGQLIAVQALTPSNVGGLEDSRVVRHGGWIMRTSLGPSLAAALAELL